MGECSLCRSHLCAEHLVRAACAAQLPAVQDVVHSCVFCLSPGCTAGPYFVEMEALDDWCSTHDYGEWADHLAQEDAERADVDAYRRLLTDEVLERLLAWIAWPGTRDECLECDHEIPEYTHPLDGPAGALRALALERPGFPKETIVWPYVAVICDEIENKGLWPEIHRWRDE